MFTAPALSTGVLPYDAIPKIPPARCINAKAVLRQRLVGILRAESESNRERQIVRSIGRIWRKTRADMLAVK
jgi:hypothetical protein